MGMVLDSLTARAAHHPHPKLKPLHWPVRAGEGGLAECTFVERQTLIPWNPTA